MRDRRYAVVVAVPHSGDFREAVAMAVCPRCGTTPDAIQATAQNALKQLWPQSRQFSVTHETAGRA